MIDVDRSTFHWVVEREFAFLLERGFEIPADGRGSTALSATVSYVGRHVAIILDLDLRDSDVGCALYRVQDGRVIPPGQPGAARRDLFTFLVEERGYRGGADRLLPQGEPLPPLFRQIRLWALELQHYAPEILAGEDVLRPDEAPASSPAARHPRRPLPG